MSSKVVSQQLITDQFSQQRSGRSLEKSKGKGKQIVGSPAGSPRKSAEAQVEVESAEDLIRKKHLQTLREFDLNWRYGPCTGITRLERWERAESHDQNPSPQIKDLILEHEDDEDYVQNTWSSYPL
ncbi:DNA polymerase delta subunit 4 [Strongylocentrotus purpuratus]|uniref:DNA polymerase delta subunit 4 n=1 Tax=Strongylocentrotus purpuratus TaxID=7668 RepID=A0A7M7GKR1_STRPU|nr:DNA polymerase delta subunit 4 [Strongylocentrotus purpuratus]